MALPPSVVQLQGVQHTNDPVTIVDYPYAVSIMEWSGAQSSAFGVSPLTFYPAALGTGVADDSAAINAAFAALAGSGVSLFFPAGKYLVTANALVTQGVNVIMGPGAIPSGTYAQVLVNAQASQAYTARAVVTTLQAYTGTGTTTLTETANGAISAADGVTLVVGDVVFVQAGTTNLTGALDSGPWTVVNLGSAGSKWVLQRPSWWANGSIMPVGAIINIGGEGTAYLGGRWKSFAAVGSAVIGTNDPAFYVDQFVSAVTLVTGFVKLGPSQTFPGIKAVGAPTDISFTPTNFNGGASTVSYRTGVYASGGSATAAGYMGTSTVSITALVAAGTFNASDVGTGLLTIRNWG